METKKYAVTVGKWHCGYRMRAWHCGNADGRMILIGVQ